MKPLAQPGQGALGPGFEQGPIGRHLVAGPATEAGAGAEALWGRGRGWAGLGEAAVLGVWPWGRIRATVLWCWSCRWGRDRCRDFGGSTLRIEISERRDARSTASTDRRPGAAPAAARKANNKVVHADNVDSESPDPRWAGELAKLKALLANQSVGV